MSSEFEYAESLVKVSGEAPAPPDHLELEHGDEVYFLARGVVNSVEFPEDGKTKAIKRVAKVKLEKGFVVDAEGAEALIAEERERQTGQGNIIAEIKRIEDAPKKQVFNDDDDDEDDFDDDPNDDEVIEQQNEDAEAITARGLLEDELEEDGE
jgi:hypothetical protein